MSSEDTRVNKGQSGAVAGIAGRIGSGVMSTVKLELRQLILQDLYAAGKPLPFSQLAKRTRLVRPNAFLRLTSTVDVLTELDDDGDLIVKDFVKSGWHSNYYYLSAREFVRMTDEVNRAARK